MNWATYSEQTMWEMRIFDESPAAAPLALGAAVSDACQLEGKDEKPPRPMPG